MALTFSPQFQRPALFLPKAKSWLSESKPSTKAKWLIPSSFSASDTNLKLQNVMLKFALELQEVRDGQLPLQISSKEVGGQRRVEASLQGVPCSWAVPVAHAHACLGANDALNLRDCRSQKNQLQQCKQRGRSINWQPCCTNFFTEENGVWSIKVQNISVP